MPAYVVYCSAAPVCTNCYSPLRTMHHSHSATACGCLDKQLYEHLPPALREKSLWHGKGRGCAIRNEIDASLTVWAVLPDSSQDGHRDNTGCPQAGLRSDHETVRFAHRLAIPEASEVRHFTVTEEREALSFRAHYCP